MCTSNVAGNTQMARLDRQVTQNGLGVNNTIRALLPLLSLGKDTGISWYHISCHKFVPAYTQLLSWFVHFAKWPYKKTRISF